MRRFLQYFTQQLRRIRALGKRGHYARALAAVEALLRDRRVFASSYIRIQRGILLQLIETDDGSHNTLEEAERSLREAVDLDPTSTEAREELGWFLCSVKNEVKEALAVFGELIRLCRYSLESAMLGRAECIYDIHGPRAALRALRDMTTHFPSSGRVREVKLFFAKAARHQQGRKSGKNPKQSMRTHVNGGRKVYHLAAEKCTTQTTK